MLSHIRANYLPKSVLILKNSLNYECANILGLTSSLYFDSSRFILSVSLLSRKGVFYESHQIINCQTLSIVTDIGAGYPGGADKAITINEQTRPGIWRKSDLRFKLKTLKEVPRMLETSFLLPVVTFLSKFLSHASAISMPLSFCLRL
jgi:hypothetical protein